MILSHIHGDSRITRGSGIRRRQEGGMQGLQRTRLALSGHSHPHKLHCA